jgi:hypothetical protein
MFPIRWRCVDLLLLSLGWFFASDRCKLGA